MKRRRALRSARDFTAFGHRSDFTDQQPFLGRKRFDSAARRGSGIIVRIVDRNAVAITEFKGIKPARQAAKFTIEGSDPDPAVLTSRTKWDRLTTGCRSLLTERLAVVAAAGRDRQSESGYNVL